MWLNANRPPPTLPTPSTCYFLAGRLTTQLRNGCQVRPTGLWGGISLAFTPPWNQYPTRTPILNLTLSRVFQPTPIPKDYSTCLNAKRTLPMLLTPCCPDCCARASAGKTASYYAHQLQQLSPTRQEASRVEQVCTH